MTRFLQTAAVFLIIFSFQNSYAHKISVFAWADGDRISVESKFNGGKRVNKGEVTVTNKKGEIVNKGETDINGEYSFSLKNKESIRIVVDAGGGHRGSWDLTAEDLGIADKVNEEKSDTFKAEPKKINVGTGTDIRDIVDEVVRERLKPLHREIALLRESKEPGFQDIIGGVGYIFGLMGIFLYFKYGRKK